MKPAVNGFESGGRIAPAPLSLRHLQTHCSTLIERALEYQFLGRLTAELLRRGLTYEVLRADIDSQGYDLLVEANGIARHIQLKASAVDGKTAAVPVNSALTAKRSGCIIWMRYDPATFEIVGWRWFGGRAAEPLPDIGNRPVRHSRRGSVRPAMREVRGAAFASLPDIGALADVLFFRSADDQLLDHLAGVQTDPDAKRRAQ